MQRYHPESAMTSEERLKRVAAHVGLALPQTPNGADPIKAEY